MEEVTVWDDGNWVWGEAAVSLKRGTVELLLWTRFENKVKIKENKKNVRKETKEKGNEMN